MVDCFKIAHSLLRRVGSFCILGNTGAFFETGGVTPPLSQSLSAPSFHTDIRKVSLLIWGEKGTKVCMRLHKGRISIEFLTCVFVCDTPRLHRVPEGLVSRLCISHLHPFRPWPGRQKSRFKILIEMIGNSLL